MLQSLALTDFQSHKETRLVLSPGINVVVGESDSGKTAILRALNWAIQNRPSGTAFQRHGTKSTEVRIETDQGELVRYRGKGNGYRINGVELSAIRTEVPNEVTQFLQIDSILNVQGQLDAPFLLSMSPGEVAQTLNRIAHLDEIDVALFNVAKHLRDKGAELKSAQTQQSDLEVQYRQFEYLDQMEIDVAELERIQQVTSEVGERFAGLRTLAQDLGQVVSDLSMLPNVDIMEMWYQEVSDAQAELCTLSANQWALQDLIDEEQRIHVMLLDLPALDGWEKQHQFCTKTNEGLVSQKRQLDTLSELLRVYGLERARLVALSEELDRQVKFYDQQMPDVCPLCGQKMK
jgi:exonuclease SbcC